MRYYYGGVKGGSSREIVGETVHVEMFNSNDKDGIVLMSIRNFVTCSQILQSSLIYVMLKMLLGLCDEERMNV